MSAPELSTRLRERMEERQISVRDLADASAVNKDTITEWRRGRTTNVRLELARRVAGSLGTTAADLLDFPAATRESETPSTSSAQTSKQIEPLVLRLEGLLEEIGGVIEEARGVGDSTT